MTSEIEARVRAQYEQYPYPLRSPEEDAALVCGETDPTASLRFMRHYGFGGHTPERPLRILVAGGGTGDATLQLAHQLQSTDHGGEIVHLEVSGAAIALTLERVERMGVRGVSVHHGSLVEATPEELGRFDYIQCASVLHHLPDPRTGMRALRRLLTDDGAMGITVNARYGRLGVYPVQDLLRRLTGPYPLPEQIAIARRMLPLLSERHPIAGHPLGYRPSLSDNEVVERFLHSCDRPFTVPEILDWTRETAMRVIDFVPAIRYRAATYVRDPWIRGAIEPLSRFERYAIGELLSFEIDRHTFFAVRDDNVVSTPEPGPDVVATLRDSDGLADQLDSDGALSITTNGSSHRIPLPPKPLYAEMIRAIDGQRSLGDVARSLDLEWERFLRTFLELYPALREGGFLTLSGPVRGR